MRMSMTPVAPEEQPSLRQIVQVTEERLLLLCKRNPLEWPGNQPLSSLVLRGEAFTPPDKPGKQSMSPLTLQEHSVGMIRLKQKVAELVSKTEHSHVEITIT